MTNNNKVLIHGKEYITVAGRLQIAHEKEKKISIQTEVLPHDTMVIVKATVTTEKGIFTGISAANPAKTIEKMSPYEVADTSAVGRALGFAGYGAVDGIATADEMAKAKEDVQELLDSQKICSNPNCPNKGIELPEKVVDYSMSVYGKPLCYRCQQEQNQREQKK